MASVTVVASNSLKSQFVSMARDQHHIHNNSNSSKLPVTSDWQAAMPTRTKVRICTISTTLLCFLHQVEPEASQW